MLKKTSQTYRIVAFLLLLAFVTADEDFLGNDFDYGSSSTLSFKNECPEYFDRFICRYWNTLKDHSSKYEKSANAFEDQQRRDTIGEREAEENPKEGLLDAPVGSLKSPPEKRFTVFRRQNPMAQGYKRGPGFRSWGGKRDYYGGEVEKRPKFTSWGGKRDGEYLMGDKRTKFTSWGGKRDEFEEFPDKRSKFRSWGGKKSTDDFLEELKRDAEAPISYDQMEKRVPFWSYRSLYPSESFKKHLPKRPQFQSWGGKRTVYPWNEFLQYYSRPQTARYDLKRLYSGEKRKFSSWGGKRNGDQNEGTLKRHTFQNWGGKRSEDNEDNDDLKPTQQRNRRQLLKPNPENVESHSGFNSWGGKRGEEEKRR